MLRRDFLRIAVLTPCIATGLGVQAFGGQARAAQTGSAPSEPLPDGRPHRFDFATQQFHLDGQPFQIRSGEMHTARIPVEYWQHRIRMAKAMGLNTIALYLMWNALESEPGVFDLKTGNRDFVHFIELCQQEGMWVYLRPGPYVCAEWDFGGLPPYLLREPDIRVRTWSDPHYTQAVKRYLDVVAPAVAPLMSNRGGPILMMQIENEYASFGNDPSYLEQLRTMWRERGIEGPFSISDGLTQVRDQKTYLAGAALGLDGDTDLAAAQKIAGDSPVWIGEGYPGWLTHWGDADLQRGNFADTLRDLLEQGRSFNLYVVHGGTNFGFTAGANANGDYSNFQPVITSYDYGAPINERGEATAEYHIFRKLLGAHRQQPLLAVPAPLPAICFEPMMPVAYASLWDNLPVATAVRKPRANEQLFAQDHGLVMYRRKIPAGAGALTIEELRDYAVVFRDGRYVDYISRVQNSRLRSGHRVDLPAAIESEDSLVDILVDSFGHIGYGHAMNDCKGIVGSIRFKDEELENWEVCSLPLDEGFISRLKPVVSAPTRPGIFFKLTLRLDQLGDTYIDMAGWNKGYLWVNGRLLGRYWNIGPQQRLYCPASWFRHGDNELLIFDLHQTVVAPIFGATTLHA